MSMQIPITNEITFIKFNVLGRSHLKELAEARGYIQGLLETADKASLVFSDVFVFRSCVLPYPNDLLTHTVFIRKYSQVLTAEQLIDLSNYRLGISNEEWVAHMSQFDRQVEPLVSGRVA